MYDCSQCKLPCIYRALFFPCEHNLCGDCVLKALFRDDINHFLCCSDPVCPLCEEPTTSTILQTWSRPSVTATCTSTTNDPTSTIAMASNTAPGGVGNEAAASKNGGDDGAAQAPTSSGDPASGTGFGVGNEGAASKNGGDDGAAQAQASSGDPTSATTLGVGNEAAAAAVSKRSANNDLVGPAKKAAKLDCADSVGRQAPDGGTDEGASDKSDNSPASPVDADDAASNKSYNDDEEDDMVPATQQ